MIISGYTVIQSDIRSFSEAVKEIRKLDWLSPEPVLVKVVNYAQEIL